MGYASNLKKIRKYSNLEIQNVLKELDKENLEDKEIFGICERALKLVEVHFSIGRKDNKMYNKYKNEIDQILHKRIFRLDLVKPKDRTSTKKTLLKKDLPTLYVLLATEFERLGFLHDTIKKNIMPSWLKTDSDKDGKFIVKPELNTQSPSIKGKEGIILKHISEVYSYILKNELENDFREKERYIELSEVVCIKLTELEATKKDETFEQSFYRYNFEQLDYLYKNILSFVNYINSYLPAIKEIYNKQKGEKE